MENNITFAELKARQNLCDKDCSIFIDSLVFRTLQGYGNRYFQSYCAYAYAMGINYEPELGGCACVTISNGYYKMFINPLKMIVSCDREEDILFIIAHEICHVILRHPEKYFNDDTDELIQFFRNITTDVEINEELGKHSRKPKSCFDIKAFSKMIGIDVSLTPSKVGSDYLYCVLGNTCKTLLGYDIGELLYLADLRKTTFVEDLKRVVNGKKTVVFSIKDGCNRTVNFCKALLAYLDKPIIKIIIPSKHHNGKKSMLDDGTDTTKSGKQKSESSVGDSKDSGANSEKSNKKSGDGNGAGDGEEGKLPSLSMSCGGGSVVLPYDCDVMNVEEILDNLEFSKEILENAINKFYSKGRGVGVSKTRQAVTFKRKRSQLPWTKILEKMAITVSNDTYFTKRRVNRRQPDRLELLGECQKNIVELVIAIDESGSIGSEELNYFLSELSQIISKIECNIHLYEFTSCIMNYTFFKNKDKKKLKNSLSKFTRYSGGTSFQPVFDAVHDNKKINDRMCVVVVLSDGIGEEEVNYRDIKNRLWVLTMDDLSCKDSKKNIHRLILGRGGDDYDY